MALAMANKCDQVLSELRHLRSSVGQVLDTLVNGERDNSEDGRESMMTELQDQINTMNSNLR